MRGAALGVALTCLYVVLEATQFVYLGGLFQWLDPFFFGFVVFGLTSLGVSLWTWRMRPIEWSAALSNRRPLFLINFYALVTFTSYLISVQLIEPTVTFSISSGMMPLTALVFAVLGGSRGEGLRNRHELFGVVIIGIGVVWLSITTLGGLSGFVRGGTGVAALGVLTAMLDGVFFTLILVQSARLNAAGVGPAAVMGMRLWLYGITMGLFSVPILGSVAMLSFWEIAGLCALGFALTIPPLYILQRATALVSTFTLAVLTALGPVVIFGLQMVEGRVVFATATLIGLALYMGGALISAYGAYQARHNRD